jgi:hypothetical protein
MKYLFVISLFVSLAFVGCQTNTNRSVEVKNRLDKKVTNQIITIELSKLPKVDINKLSAFDGEVEIPSQLVDSDADGKIDNFTFLINLDANQTKKITLLETDNKKHFKQRAHAELSEKRDSKFVDGVYTGGKFVRVTKTKTPQGHVDHNLYYKCEGPCWESDKVAYRFYIDQRNATDIFGKRTNEIVMPNVGHTYDDSGNEMYHHMDDWGMDIFKVGSSLGMGSFAAFADGKVEMVTKRDSVIGTIVNDGPIVATVNTKYYGWKFADKTIDINSTLTITAGSRLTKCDLTINGNHETYCSGLAKHSGTEFVKTEYENGWNYIALWGKQTAVNDNLGIVLFYKKEGTTKLAEDELSYIVTFTPQQGKIQYYYAAYWEQELNGVKTKDEFIKSIDEEIEKLNNPVKVIE